MAKLQNGQVFNYKLVQPVYNLSIIKEFFKISKDIVIYGELEIEPFTGFSLAFQAEYWYLKYHLLLNNAVN